MVHIGWKNLEVGEIMRIINRHDIIDYSKENLMFVRSLPKEENYYKNCDELDSY